MIISCWEVGKVAAGTTKYSPVDYLHLHISRGGSIYYLHPSSQGLLTISIDCGPMPFRELYSQ